MQQERELGETRQCRTEEHPEAVDAVVEAAAAALPLADVREERPHRPANNKKLMDRIRDQKNRTVQRLLVALHLAKPSVDLQYKQRQQELACDIERLQASRQLIQDYVDQIVPLGAAIRTLAGDSSAPVTQQSGDSFLEIARLIDETGYSFAELVGSSIIRNMDERIEKLENALALIVERSKLQLDLDYATRTLIVAEQKGDVNRIAARKQARRVIQLDWEQAARTIEDCLELVDSDRHTDVDDFLAMFASLLKDYYSSNAKLFQSVIV